jgi:serine/threonine protein kinase
MDNPADDLGLTTDKARPKKYIILKSLGKGSFGRVKEALHVASGEKIAIKILEKSRIKKEDDMKRIRREINILTKVNHPNIIQLYETIETYKYFFFVMEYAKVGELSDWIEKKDKLTEKESCKLFQQLVSAVEYLHKLGCAHRDIKPSNILLDEN